MATIATLLREVGHGPFSHAFERVQTSRSVGKRHEKWTGESIRDPEGAIGPLLEAHRADFTLAMASLLAAEDPTDIDHVVVSISFDADRLDYRQRDRLITGTGAGATDFDRMMEHVRIADIAIEPPEGHAAEDTTRVAAFCLDPRALPAAEQFLLSRYTLHEQVYRHKTTRCIEATTGKLLGRIAKAAAEPDTASAQTGLDSSHVLLRFFAPCGTTIDNHLVVRLRCVDGYGSGSIGSPRCPDSCRSATIRFPGLHGTLAAAPLRPFARHFWNRTPEISSHAGISACSPFVRHAAGGCTGKVHRTPAAPAE